MKQRQIFYSPEGTAEYDMVNRINKIGRLVFVNDPVRLVLFESKWPSYTHDDSEV